MARKRHVVDISHNRLCLCHCLTTEITKCTSEQLQFRVISIKTQCMGAERAGEKQTDGNAGHIRDRHMLTLNISCMSAELL